MGPLLLSPFVSGHFYIQITCIPLHPICWRICFVCVCVFAFSRASPMANGGSQTRGRIGAVPNGLLQSHSNVGSEPLTATLDP